MRKIDIYASAEDPELFTVVLKTSILYFVLSLLTTAFLFFVPVEIDQFLPTGEYFIPVLNTYYSVILESAGERYFSKLVLIYNKDYLLLVIMVAVYIFRITIQIKSGEFRYFLKIDKSLFAYAVIIGMSVYFIIRSFHEPIGIPGTAFFRMTILEGGYLFGLYQNTLIFPFCALLIAICIYSYLAAHCVPKNFEYKNYCD